MNGAEVLDVARDAIITLVLVSSPLMLVGLAIGVVGGVGPPRVGGPGSNRRPPPARSPSLGYLIREANYIPMPPMSPIPP